MKTLVAILLFVFAASAPAQEAPIQGGRSKDGRYEVRIVGDADREPSNYVLAIYDARARKRLLRVEDVGGIAHYDDARQSAKALWNEAGTLVVVTDSGTRHSQEILLFHVSDGSALRVSLPDYVQNALGRMGGTETDLHCRSEPARWEGEQLHVFLRFAVSDPAHGRVFYACEVVLDCQSRTSARLERVSVPELEGDD